LFAGCGIAFVTEYFDHTIRRAGDIALFTSLPVVGSIRHVKSLR
jgi:capsular polysaccharide biosynthesis protein